MSIYKISRKPISIMQAFTITEGIKELEANHWGYDICTIVGIFTTIISFAYFDAVVL